MMTEFDFSGRIALVTGASRGIGREVALALGKAGAHVVAVARTVGGLEELDDDIRAAGGPAPTLVPLDLADLPAIDRLGGALYERFGRLDALVGNAALLGVLSPVGHLEPKTVDQVMTVNVNASWRLIRSMDPLLRLSPAGRAVFLSSSVAHQSRPYWSLYAATKAAMEIFVLTWAAENAHGPLRINLVNPGRLRTSMRARAMPGEDPMTLKPPEVVVPPILRLLSPETTATGLIYDFPTDRMTALSPPAPVEG